MLRTAQSLPQRALDTGLRPGPFPTRAASLLPGLLTATRTGLTPASDDEHEQRKHPAKSRGHLLFHWAHEWSNYLAHSGRAIWLSFEYLRGQVPVVYRIIAGRELAEPSRRSGQRQLIRPRWATYRDQR